jgi:hypothetical protein
VECLAAEGSMASDKATLDTGTDHQSARAVRRREDITRFLERFEVLTGMRAHSASVQGLPPEFIAREVPEPKLLLERYAQKLEPRTYNALCRYEPGREARPWTFARLLDVRGFGLFCLLDLLEVLPEQERRGPATPP